MLQNKEIRRGDNKNITFVIDGDYSADAIMFTAKRDKTLTSARVLEKKNTLAGGDDNEMTVVYDSDSLTSTITIKILETETQALTDEYFYFDIYDDTDNDTLFWGKLWLLADVRTPYDSGSVPDDSLPIISKSIYIEIVDGVITQESYYGFTTDPDASVSSDASFDILTITSDGELELTGIADSNNRDWDVIDWTDTDSMTFYWSLGKFTGRTISFFWNYYSV